jgi:cell division protein FtsB
MTKDQLEKFIVELVEKNKKMSEKIGQLEEENKKLKKERDEYYGEWHLRHS